jgi:IS5 family transposase
MGSQMSFGDLKFQGQRKKTRREAFLERMDAIVPWDSWIALVDTSYHSQARGRHVRSAETMLRMYLLQVMFGLLRRGNLKMLSWIVGPISASCT